MQFVWLKQNQVASCNKHRKVNVWQLLSDLNKLYVQHDTIV